MWKKILSGALTIACWVYLAGGVVGTLAFILFVLGVIFPAASLFADSPPIRRFRPELRIPLAATSVLLCAAPWFYLRRWVPLPAVVSDLILVCLLTSWSVCRGHYREWLTDLRTPALRHVYLHLGIFLPILFAFTWAGYQVRNGDHVIYYGLFPTDFANLACMVTLVKASPGLPLAPVPGTGPLHYHWLHFALAADLSTFLGISLPNGTSLILSNYITASLLMVVVGYLTGYALPAERRRRVGALAATLVVFAPLSTYAYTGFVQFAHLHGLKLGVRNHLVVSIVNSMPVFGNNSFAIVLAMLVLALSSARTYRQDESSEPGPASVPSAGVIIMAAVFLFAMIGYSVTLFFPLAAALGVAFLTGRIARPVLVSIVTPIVGSISMGVMYKLNMISGGTDKRIAFAFDHGRFLHILVVGMAPLWIWVFASWRCSRRAWPLHWLSLATCFLVPTFLYLAGSEGGLVDFSMKIGSLIIIVCAPMVSVGMDLLSRDPLKVGAGKWLRGVAIGLATLGLINTLVYTFQFAFFRLVNPHPERSESVNAQYVEALRYVRDNAALNQIVIDPQTLDELAWNSAQLIAERRVFLPTISTLIRSNSVMPGSEVQTRVGDYKHWERSGYQNTSLSTRFANGGDYLILRGGAVLDENWHRTAEFGDYSVYRSVRRRSR